MKKYTCSVCGTPFGDKILKEKCEENKNITHTTILKENDTVKTKHHGEALIKKKIILDRTWGGSKWEEYWHTEALIVEYTNNNTKMASLLTYDEYYDDVKKTRSLKMKNIM